MLNLYYPDQNKKLKENASRRRPARKRRMNEDLNPIPAEAKKYVQLSDYDAGDEGGYPVGTVLPAHDGEKYAIVSYLDPTPDYEEFDEWPYILFQRLSDGEYFVGDLVNSGRGHVAYIEYDPSRIGQKYFYESMRRKRASRKRRMNEDSEKRDCTFDVDYEGDYFSDLSSRGIIDFNDVFEKVQNILYFKYPEAYAVKVGYDEIEIRNLTEDDCEFIEDDIYRNLVNWYQDIEEHGNPNRWTESVSRKR